MKTYKTTRTCSSTINYEVADGVALLKGTQCRNGTSCPGQLARALEAECA